jgi:PKD repeat protein
MKYLFTILIILNVLVLSAQISTPESVANQQALGSGEIYFKFRIDDRTSLEILTRIVSIDQFENGVCFAYANEQELEEFKKLGIEFEILPHPGSLLKDPKMLTSIEDKGLLAWDFYPTYSVYVEMMYQFAANYPDLCQVFSIGTTVQGRQLLVAKISDNIAVREAEPQFLYTGTIHGDELTGGILMLRLIDYLLTNYGTNAKVTNLVNNIEIWINPLANPDGTYYGGNNTVNGARRYNANSIDLNRNYPDPQDGQHPDGNAWQPETLAFMQLAEENHFVMSANTHGGVEVLNYPWDTWLQLAADDTWWINVCRQYVDTVHLYSPSTYMDYLNNGITRGAIWYMISGGRQDYMNYFHHCREVTMELSDVKLIPASQLPNHWNWNYRSLLNYMEQCIYGVHGIVTDSVSGLPIEARVEIIGHDIDESFVYADPELGNYHRLLAPGTYNFTFSIPGAPTKTIKNVQVVKNQTTNLNVQLNPGPLVADFQASAASMPAGRKVDFTNLSTGNPVSWQWWFEGGNPSVSSESDPKNILYQNPGNYSVQLKIFSAAGDSAVLIKQNFILVKPDYTMMNASFEVCSGTFYDSGGEVSNYSNNEDYILTFYPATAQAKIEVSFLSFDVQSIAGCTYDFLNVFDGSGISSPLIGKYCGTNSPGTVVATNSEGALTFQFHSNVSTTRPGWKGIIGCRAQQSIALNAGWNGLSSFVQPENADFDVLFGPIMNQIVIIQSTNGFFLPGQNINTLGEWNSEQGYQIKMLENRTVEMGGLLAAGNTLSLNIGWNLIPVLSSVPVSVEDLIKGIAQKIVIIKESTGLQLYWPSANITSLQYLQPGKSYFIKASEAVTINFPEE